MQPPGSPHVRQVLRRPTGPSASPLPVPTAPYNKQTLVLQTPNSLVQQPVVVVPDLFVLLEVEL